MNVFTELDKPLVFKIPETDKSSFKPSPKFSRNIDYPSFCLGFQHYIHANKDKLDILSEFTNKKKVYMVIDKLNKDIDEYDEDLSNVAKKMFGKNMEQDYFIYWELLSCFNLFQKSVYSRLSSDSANSAVKELSKKLGIKLEFYNKPTRTDLVLVSYEGGNYDYRNVVEQDSLSHLMKEIEESLKYLNKNGCLVVKFHEIYTETTNKLIHCLSTIFSESYFYKPLSLPQSSSEKFIVFIKLKDSPDNVIKMLNVINTPPKGYYIVDMFNKYTLPNEYISVVRKFNTDFANRQLMDVNKIVEFIKSENYYGETYQKYRDRQITYTKKWIEKYFTDIKKNKDSIVDSIKKLAKVLNEKADKLDKKLT